MIDPNKSKQRKATAIKSLAAIFNIAAVIPFATMLMHRESRFTPSHVAQRQLLSFSKLPEDDPVSQRIKAMGAAQSISLDVYIKSNDKDFKNMCIYKRGATHRGYGRINKALICIEGNPMSLPQGLDSMDAIVAHEIEHMKQDDHLLQDCAVSNMLSYPLYALLGPIMLSNDLGRSALFIAPLCLAIATGMYFLKQCQSRNDEHLADLASMKTTGNNHLTDVLEWMKEKYAAQLPDHSSLWNRLIRTHPSVDDRIALMKDAETYKAAQASPTCRI